jgi:hypothetical protein
MSKMLRMRRISLSSSSQSWSPQSDLRAGLIVAVGHRGKPLREINAICGVINHCHG